MRSLLLAIVLFLAVAPPIRGQESLAVVRLVTARDGGPVPVGETAAFEATDSKAVAWVQFAAPAQTHAMVFRWLDPDGRLQRTSPSRILLRGQKFAWDDLLIRGHAPEYLAGLWTAQLYVDDRLLTAVRFSILRNTVASQMTVRLREQRTPVASLSAGRVEGASDGYGYNTSQIFSHTLRPGLSTQMGIEASQTANFLDIPPRQVQAGAMFFDLRYGRPNWPSFSLTFRHDREIDDRSPHLTDSVTTSWVLSSSYFKGRFSFSGTYSSQAVDDRTLADTDFVSRTLILTAAYSPSPWLSLSVTRTSLAQDFKATTLSPTFTQRTDITVGRLTYQPTPNLSVALFALETAATRSDTSVTSSISQRGLEAAYRLNATLSLKVLTQWQEQTTLGDGFASRSDQRMSSYGIDVFLPRNLTIGLAYGPQVTTTGPSIIRADVLTAYASFSPSPRFFFTGTYALARTTGVGIDAINRAWSLSIRYAPSPWVEYQGTAQVNDAQYFLFPTANTSNATYQVTASWRF